MPNFTMHGSDIYALTGLFVVINAMRLAIVFELIHFRKAS
jgi:hypothetical protein